MCQQDFNVISNRFECRLCNFIFFNNTATGVEVIIEYDGKFIFTKRAKDPQKGKLDLAGGFVSIRNAIARFQKEF